MDRHYLRTLGPLYAEMPADIPIVIEHCVHMW
jgi:hypothetical protein